ncbi:DUF998 domain-containing protein [Hoeflea sp.]|uniref:DUF998 domain-containing protein n=1 Tax=Hoeflea sp. TaxID=1940281 RepID=UPI001985F4BF|nr:DUF998 domain-containing protein [Hoeflea sp.]MBC7280518.1 DUF998 domain-containing protein [Hoeflea sp.]
MKPAPFYLAGALAPLVFLASVIYGAARRAGYSHLADPVSLLGMAGAADAGMINALWVVSGLLIILLGAGFWLDQAGPGRWTATWVMLAGAGSAAIAFWFPMDPPGAPLSRSQIGHNALVAVAGLSFALALITAAYAAAPPRAFRRFSWIALAAMVAGGAGAALSAAMGWPLVGLFERVTQAGYHSWLLVTAILGVTGWGAR